RSKRDCSSDVCSSDLLLATACAGRGEHAGKVASVFTSTGTGGGEEMTITSTWTTLAHHGMIIVPIGYATPELFDISQVGGGTPYGASTIAGGDGSRQPDERELAIARFQGETVAKIATRLQASA